MDVRRNLKQRHATATCEGIQVCVPISDSGSVPLSIGRNLVGEGAGDIRRKKGRLTGQVCFVYRTLLSLRSLI